MSLGREVGDVMQADHRARDVGLAASGWLKESCRKILESWGWRGCHLRGGGHGVWLGVWG